MVGSRSFSLTLVLTLAVAGFMTAAVVAAAPTVTLEKALHFTTPTGDDVVLGPGTYEVEAKEQALRLTPKDGNPENATLIQAKPLSHVDPLDAPKAVAERMDEETFRIGLLQPGGTGLETMGSTSGLRTRGVCNMCAALGTGALGANILGNWNAAIGYRALATNTTGSGNTAIGANALSQSSTNYLTAIGSNALMRNAAGTSNTAIGAWALMENTNGVSNTAVGALALRFNTSGNNNTANGSLALTSNLGGIDNTAVGADALRSNSTGNTNTAVGTAALTLNQAGQANTAIGFGALSNNYTNSNTAIGAKALSANSDGVENTALGAEALRRNTGGKANTATGFQALAANTFGSQNTAIGSSALSSNTVGKSNTAIGANALQANTFDYNTAIGAEALRSNTTGSANTALGYAALKNNVSGSFNTAVGAQVGHLGSSNTFIGMCMAGNQSCTGSFNTGVGWPGMGTGSLIRPIGDHNILLGGSTGLLSGATGTIHIGQGDPYALRYGLPIVHNQTFIAGIADADIGVNAAAVVITPDGRLGIQSSSRRSKQDIRDMGAESERLLYLRPVTFRYKPEIAGEARSQEYGLIAEEVAEVYPELVGRGPDGDSMTVHYQKLLPLLLNELQQQWTLIEEQDRQIAEQQTQMTELSKFRHTLETLMPGLANPGHHEASSSNPGGATW